MLGGFEEEEEEPKERLGSVRENPKGRRVLGAVEVEDPVIGPLDTAAGGMRADCQQEFWT